MLATVFEFGKSLVRGAMQWLNQKIQQWTRPSNGNVVFEALTDVLRPKPELVLDNALLRQQLIVLRRKAKRPQPTNTDRRVLVVLPSTGLAQGPAAGQA